MAYFQVCFEMRRLPGGTVSWDRLYPAFLEMCKYVDENGFDSVWLGEHHASEDGYLPCPVTALAAVAACTKRVGLRPIILTPLYDPLRLAEDIALVDQFSSGRMSPLFASGYRTVEFNMFGKKLTDRVKLVKEAIEVCKKGWTGEWFEYQERKVRITPTPFQQPRPPIYLGASFEKTVRRAAHIADSFYPGDPAHWDWFRDECIVIGRSDPGTTPKNCPTYVFVSEDPEKAWADITPHYMHNGNSYYEWMFEEWGKSLENFPRTTLENIRTNPEYAVLTPKEAIKMCNELGEDGIFRPWPLIGGLDPDIAWKSLELIVNKVMPHVHVPSTPSRTWRVPVEV